MQRNSCNKEYLDYGLLQNCIIIAFETNHSTNSTARKKIQTRRERSLGEKR